MGSHAVLLLPYICIWACVTLSDIIPYRILRYNTMERRYGQLLGNELSDIGVMFLPAIFEDLCVDLRISMCRLSKIDVSTFRDQ